MIGTLSRDPYATRSGSASYPKRRRFTVALCISTPPCARCSKRAYPHRARPAWVHGGGRLLTARSVRRRLIAGARQRSGESAVGRVLGERAMRALAPLTARCAEPLPVIGTGAWCHDRSSPGRSATRRVPNSRARALRGAGSYLERSEQWRHAVARRDAVRRRHDPATPADTDSDDA